MGPKSSNAPNHIYPRISYFEPICCWSCGHYLGSECKDCQQEGCSLIEHQTVEFRNRQRKCNGLAFDCDYETLTRIRSTRRPEPFPDNHYALSNGKQVYVHSNVDGKIYCNLDTICEYCGMMH